MTISGLSGVSWPWRSGYPRFIYDEDVIYQAIVDVIFTVVGERKMNTRYGSEVIRVVFENKGPILNALAQREITLAIRTHLPMVEVLNIDVSEGERDTDPVDIVVDYTYQGLRSQAKVSVEREV
jgi:phage baseplate assembly protein W